MKYFTSSTRFIFFAIIFFISLSRASAQSPIPSGAKVEVVATGIQQSEGPVWVDGVGLLFSDIRAAKIYKLTPENNKDIYLAHSDSSNGLTLDLQGRLVLTQMGKRQVSRQETDGTITPLATTYNGKKFNSPNDIVVKSDGSIFFTDPDFNIPGGLPSELGFQGIYRISPSGNIQLLDNSYKKPNGICFSPDEKKLYVNESAKGEIYVWDVIDDSTIANKTLFNKVSPYADGMKVDVDGNIYCASNGGVTIFSPAGVYLAKIAIPNGSTSNCAWGDADRKTLYITGGTSVYKIRMADPSGVKENHGSNIPNSIKLFQNYPNPFNPETTIGYNISTVGTRSAVPVQLKVYDILGREVATLVNEEKPAGNYEVKFNADTLNRTSLSSSIYYYCLNAGNFSLTKKMILMK